VRISGSHHIFDRPGGPLISIPVHNGMVKPGYGKRVQKIIDAGQGKSQGDGERGTGNGGKQGGDEAQGE
jgi:hypothetical protein